MVNQEDINPNEENRLLTVQMRKALERLAASNERITDLTGLVVDENPEKEQIWPTATQHNG